MTTNCPTCGISLYDSAVDCRRSDHSMLVDTCQTVRGDGGYCAHHPSTMSMDSGPVHPTRATAAREHAAYEWGCDPRDVAARKTGTPTRYRCTRAR